MVVLVALQSGEQTCRDGCVWSLLHCQHLNFREARKQWQHLSGVQGVELLIHVDGFSGPQEDGWKALMDLGAASSLIVTEEMPTSPYAQWSKVAGLLASWRAFT